MHEECAQYDSAAEESTGKKQGASSTPAPRENSDSRPAYGSVYGKVWAPPAPLGHTIPIENGSAAACPWVS